MPSCWLIRTTFLTIAMGVAVAAAPGLPLAAQLPARVEVSDTLWQLRLADGSTIYGRVVAEDEGRITVLSDAGVRIELERAQIRAMTPMRGVLREGEFWPTDPNLTRLFFGPTGRMLGGGEGYAGVFELFLPFVAVGLTDWFTFAGGTPVLPEVIGRVIYLAPKARIFQSDQVDLSGGVLAFFSSMGDFESAGILYAAGTAGSPDNAVTVGAGWPFSGGEIENLPVFMAGAESRVSRRIKLISENYLISVRSSRWEQGRQRDIIERSGILTGGVRVIGEHLSADAGLGLLVSTGDSFCCVPLVNFVYNFGPGR